MRLINIFKNPILITHVDPDAWVLALQVEDPRIRDEAISHPLGTSPFTQQK